MRTVPIKNMFARTAVLAALAGAGAGASAEPPLVSEVSNDSSPGCRIDPFGDLGARQRESQWLTGCGGDHAQLKLESPRPAFNNPDTRYTKAEVGTLSTRTVAGVLSTLRFSWSGARDQESGRGRSNSTMVAAGGMVKLFDDVDLQMSLGRQLVGVSQTRATVNSSWRPTTRGLLFTEWSTSMLPGSDVRRVGALFWLIPTRLAIDFGARYLPDGGGWQDERIGLTFTAAAF